MNEIIGKTVYILGAGASVDAGAPLLANFLTRARELEFRTRDIHFADSFKRVFDWIKVLKRSSYNIDLNLDNLEHVFSIADLGSQIGLRGYRRYFADLKRMIVEVVDKCEFKAAEHHEYAALGYTNFIRVLRGSNAQRRKDTSEGQGPFQPDSVITFNYDVFIDYAWVNGNEQSFLNYCLDAPVDQLPYPTRLLKLHGSANWAWCPKCGKVEQFEPRCFDRDASRTPGHTHVLQLGLAEYTFRRGCQKCGVERQLEPLIVPPTWSKQVRTLPLVSVWKTAVDELGAASQLVILGYSLPQTDTFLQYLLAVGMSENRFLRRVLVVNTDDSESFKERYRRVFSRSLSDRSSLLFIPMDFREFCLTHMKAANWSTEDLQKRFQKAASRR